MRRCQKTPRFRQVFVNFDFLLVFGLCPFSLGVHEVVLYGCNIVYLILNIYLWIVDLFLGYGEKL